MAHAQAEEPLILTPVDETDSALWWLRQQQATERSAPLDPEQLAADMRRIQQQEAASQPSMAETIAHAERQVPALDLEAAHLLSWIAHADPATATRIRIALDQRHWNAQEFIAACVVYICDHSLQTGLRIPERLRARLSSTGTTGVCRHCGKDFSVRFTGQSCCSTPCGDAVFGRTLPVID